MPTSLSAEDRFAVVDAIQAYAQAVDTGRWELFDRAFTRDADLDYTSAGGPRGGPDELHTWLAKAREGLLGWQHHLSPPRIEAADGAVRAVTDVYTPNLFRDPSGETGLLHTGGRYHDELVRTPRGWRIARRRFETVWVHGPGAGDMIPDPTRTR
jgi:hypothetical protein